MVKDRAVDTLRKNKVDTLPKVSSIIGYMGHKRISILNTNHKISVSLQAIKFTSI